MHRRLQRAYTPNISPPLSHQAGKPLWEILQFATRRAFRPFVTFEQIEPIPRVIGLIPDRQKDRLPGKAFQKLITGAIS